MKTLRVIFSIIRGDKCKYVNKQDHINILNYRCPRSSGSADCHLLLVVVLCVSGCQCGVKSWIVDLSSCYMCFWTVKFVLYHRYNLPTVNVVLYYQHKYVYVYQNCFIFSNTILIIFKLLVDRLLIKVIVLWMLLAHSISVQDWNNDGSMGKDYGRRRFELWRASGVTPNVSDWHHHILIM